MSVKIDIQHAPEVAAALKRAHAQLPPKLKQAASQARRLLVAALQVYPPERPGQRYKRTGALRRGWQRSVPLDRGLGFQLINSTESAFWAQGDKQAWMHVGRWQTAAQIAEAHAEEVRALYEDAAREATDV